MANVWQAQEIRLGGRRSTEAIVGDETGNVRVVWFNNPYVAAAGGFVDKVIRPADSRREAIAALEALLNKKETLPQKKHGNMPL